MPLPLLPGGPEEPLQPLLQDAVRDCYDEPCHWLQGALPRPHMGPQTDDLAMVPVSDVPDAFANIADTIPHTLDLDSFLGYFEMT